MIQKKVQFGPNDKNGGETEATIVVVPLQADYYSSGSSTGTFQESVGSYLKD